ncbi:hypothetical protein [Pseudoroseomonas aestuarii]
MFPIRDRRGRIVSFGGRVLGDAQPKYVNGPETELFSKRRNLYGADRRARPPSRARPWWWWRATWTSSPCTRRGSAAPWPRSARR